MRFKDLDTSSGPSKYYKLKTGSNKFRIVSEAIPVWTAFDRANKTARKYLEASQAQGDKEARMRYAMYVIDRTDGNIKVAEFGTSIVNQIQELACSDQYGFDDLPNYDMTIIRKGEGLETEYALIADRQDTPLSALESTQVVALESLKDFMKRDIEATLARRENDLNQPPF